MKEKTKTKKRAKKKAKKVSKKTEQRKKLAEWKEKVKERDNNTCQICKRNKEKDNLRLHVHHILDKKNFPDFKYKVMNGITLCYHCHKVGKCSAHLNAIFFALWLKENKPDLYNFAMENLFKFEKIKEKLNDAVVQMVRTSAL